MRAFVAAPAAPPPFFPLSIDGAFSHMAQRCLPLSFERGPRLP
jgi:hypothetical protein